MVRRIRMYPIVKREKLADKIYLMDVEAPRVAKHCEPGQFVIVKIDETGERIPLTICDYDREAGTITIVFQVVGASTERMAGLKEGDIFQDFVGPLGCPSDLTVEPEELKKKKIVFIAGGVGTAPVYPQVKWLHEHGVDCDVIMGSRNKELLILEEEMRRVASNLYITTDDGSYGFHGTGTGAGGSGKNIRSLRCDRADDYDEICLYTDEGARTSDDCFDEPDYGGRNRDVRRLPPDGGRKSKICLRGRARIQRSSRGF